MNFIDITYLKSGNKKQRKAYSTLTENNILLKLTEFSPIVVGTIPINIDIETSDIDIICYFTNKEHFTSTLNASFEKEKGFHVYEKEDGSIVANFNINEFEIEVFGQNIPSKQQFAYRHMLIEYQLLNEKGEEFRKQIINLKKQGYKTEPAFAMLLNIEGNPYTELLKYENEHEKTFTKGNDILREFPYDQNVKNIK